MYLLTESYILSILNIGMVMTKDDIAKFRELYVQTAIVYLKDLETNLMVYRNDNTNQTAVKNIHLASHSLAGQSSMMGYTNLSIYSGLIEKIFRDQKNGFADISSKALDVIIGSMGKLHESLMHIEKTGEEIKMTDEIEELKMILI